MSDEGMPTFRPKAQNVRTAILAMILLIVGFIAGAVLMSGRSLSAADVEALIQQYSRTQSRTAYETRSAALVDDDPSSGPVDAPITIVEFSDFYCSFCVRFANETMSQIKERYGDQVRFVYRDLPITSGQPAIDAAVAANCAHDQGNFWGYHDIIFANSSAQSREMYVSFASELGMDAGAFTLCLDNPKSLDEITLDYIDATALGVDSTPRFFVNDSVIFGAMPFETFALVIDRELEKAGVEPSQ